ncbi:alanine--tRNA ligase [Candidatus Absconditicoccus praedator]|uniref:alanine--tRNA ligase n=1 Tax=Candidatus Absconditicoccus praedator TaxID=2735562 RepID=UPI001E2FDCE7|nr:alanine--tRNA ligase [Candidatus Absconditicoccus praedator]UFX83430.1 alanine--tRNA ligase [Candidatus Absconditicoccus praedator]
MKKLTSEEIRKLWDEFWQDPDRNHTYLKYASLVPDSQDKTVLFTTAGMQQLVPYLVGKPHPQGKRLYNTQKSLRTGDIDEVGDERHLTFFEMLGNWSLGDYFKKESLTWSIRFLNEYIGVPMEKIGVTIFAGDESLGIGEDTEARKILNEIGIPDQRIKAIGMEDNFRGPAGEIGPCGPCAEIHIDRGEEWGPNDWDMGENDRFLEVWNNVFMEFYKNEDGTFSKLSQQNVDTGMGLERLAMILQGQQTVFECDLFEFIMLAIQDLVDKKYPPFEKHENDFSDKENNTTKHFRIIADHIRTAVFMIGDGVIASNEGRGYVLRRLIRRLYYSVISLDENAKLDDFVKNLVDQINKKYGTYYIEISNNTESIVSSILNEISQFQKTINNGRQKLNEIMKNSSKEIEGKNIFLLYDTYGFPVELTKEIATDNGLAVDLCGFEKEMEKARERSREGTKDVFKRGIDWAKYLHGIPATKFVGYDTLETQDSSVLKDFEVDGQRVVVLDKTPFYAESGGQTSDTGSLILDDGEELKVVGVENYAGVYLHFVNN